MDTTLNRPATRSVIVPRAGDHPIRRALLLLDDLERRHVISHVLQGEGYVVVEVPSGSDLLYRLVSDVIARRDPPYDVVVGELGASDGFGLRALAELGRTQVDVNVVFVAADRPPDPRELRAALRTSGSRTYGTKPASTECPSPPSQAER